MGKVVRVQPIPEQQGKPLKLDDLHAEICFFYPQYSFGQARQLPMRRVIHLIKTARRLKAAEYYELAQIAAAPHTEKGEGFKELIKRYEREKRNG